METYEDNLVDALSQLETVERNAILTALKRRLPICVGVWAATGEKQSYSCIMGTAAAVMAEQSVGDWVACYRKDPNIINEALTKAGTYYVPEAFDELFSNSPESHLYIVRAVGGGAEILNERGRNLLRDLVLRASA